MSGSEAYRRIKARVHAYDSGSRDCGRAFVLIDDLNEILDGVITESVPVLAPPSPREHHPVKAFFIRLRDRIFGR